MGSQVRSHRQDCRPKRLILNSELTLCRSRDRVTECRPQSDDVPLLLMTPPALWAHPERGQRNPEKSGEGCQNGQAPMPLPQQKRDEQSAIRLQSGSQAEPSCGEVGVSFPG